MPAWDRLSDIRAARVDGNREIRRQPINAAAPQMAALGTSQGLETPEQGWIQSQPANQCHLLYLIKEREGSLARLLNLAATAWFTSALC